MRLFDLGIDVAEILLRLVVFLIIAWPPVGIDGIVKSIGDAALLRQRPLREGQKLHAWRRSQSWNGGI